MKLIKPKNDQKWKAFFGCLKGKGKCLGTIKESDWQAELANRAAKDVPQGEAEPHGEAPEELPTQSGQEPDGAQAQIGARKNKALGRIKGNLYEKELKELVLRARTAEDMTDVETVISDREKEY